MDIELTEPQAEFFHSTAKATCAVAGFGSGKTQVAMYRLISSAIEYPENDWLYSAPTIPLIRDILWSKLDEFLPSMGLRHSINKQEGIVYLHGLGKIFCRSMDAPDRLVGFEVADAFMDEIDILPEDKALNVYRKIKARCRQKIVHPVTKQVKPNQQWVTTTPEGFRATYKLFKKNPAAGSYLVQMSTYSNAHNLPDDYIDDLKANYPEQLIRAYLLGEFVNLTNNPVWASFDPIANSVVDAEIKRGEVLHIGQDFNVGRGCAVVYVHRTLPPKHPFNPRRDNEVPEPWDILIAVGEVVDTFDTPDTIRVLNEHYPATVFNERVVYPDATSKSRKSVNATISDLSLMRSADFHVRTNNRNPNIKDRVTAGNAAFCNSLGERRVYVDTERCPHYTEKLQQQVYDSNGLPEKGVGKGDDITDAGTYPINWFFPAKRSRMFVERLGGL